MKRESRVMEAFLKCAQKLAEWEVINCVSYSPVTCGAIFHQPKRPKEMTYMHEDENDSH